MAAPDIPVESLYIAGGVCGGIILFLVAILLFFCCAPRRKAKRPDFEAAESHRRPQPIAVNEPQEISPSKPFARVAPTHQTPSAPPDHVGVENFGADLSDSLNDRRQLYTADPLGACRAPPQYVEVTADYLHETSHDPPPAYPSPLNRRWQSTGQLDPVVLSVSNLQDHGYHRGFSSQDCLDMADVGDGFGDADKSRRPKRVVYEVVV